MPAPTKPSTKLAEAIRHHRKNAGFRRQIDLADLLGVHQATVSSWESGANRPDHQAMFDLHSLIGLPLELFWADVQPGVPTDASNQDVNGRYLPTPLGANPDEPLTSADAPLAQVAA